MRVLYGIVGEGMGHATRSRVVIEHLLASGHEVRVVVSGRAHKFLTDKLKGRVGIAIDEIVGINLAFDGNELDVADSLITNIEKVPDALKKNVDVYREVIGSFDAQVAISDFESFTYFFARVNGVPVISIDNMQVINRCRHDRFVTADKSFAFRVAKLAVKAKLPGAYHYLVSSFFFPQVRKPRTTLVPPILRPEILAAKRERKDHVLVYQTATTNQDLIPALQKLPQRFRVYGMGRTGEEGNVTLCAFSEAGFVDDLRTARAVIAGGGYSLMGEAVHLHVPMLSVPIRGQYEQELNARYLQRLGYGQFVEELTADAVVAFLEKTDTMEGALARYQPQDNRMLFACLEELLRDVDLSEPPPQRLKCKAMGAWDGPDLPPHLAAAIENDEDETVTAQKKG
ncbi:MAG: teichoic acid biosynthesis protein [Deltaproteobacteria bacterium]|nr:teichoic acid biosynthesis protein [Deltaproteobacteria bacterium]